ncbi:protein FAM98B isoform X1 [Oncorhynchus tshawytscha]|uniref:protein FAM98B isoform X1 n=1 Tax=Oncorhynchus tshawytscha TaxID=74940 RepID=UPI000D09BFE0|nr:protein FAM98B isoform X1 [Oncorhynchus tshawytscha]
MESDILDALEQVGYEGPLQTEERLVRACEGGLLSTEYVNLCMWLASRLKPLCDLEESISSGSGDTDGLQFEMSGMLKELQCPYQGLVSGIIQEGLQNKKDYLKLVLFLCSELQAAQIVKGRPAKDKEHKDRNDLQAICETLKLPELREQGVAELFSGIGKQINAVLQELPKDHIGKPVLKNSLDSEQWERLEQINTVLSSEYECRRRMLIKRLDVTVQSFGWSERAKERVDSMARAYQPKRHTLAQSSSVGMAHLLAAREDICNVVKTSSGSSRENTACAVNKILMGRVPDRGGRPSEIDAPLPEMPAWQKRQDGGGGWGGRGGGGWGGGKSGWRGGGAGWGHGGKRGRYQY